MSLKHFVVSESKESSQNVMGHVKRTQSQFEEAPTANL